MRRRSSATLGNAKLNCSWHCFTIANVYEMCWIVNLKSESELLYSVLLWNHHLPIRYRHRHSGSTAYRPGPRPQPCPALICRLMAAPSWSMELHGSLLIDRPRRDGRLSWPSWLTHSGRLIHVNHGLGQISESPPATDRRPNHWATPPIVRQLLLSWPLNI